MVKAVGYILFVVVFVFAFQLWNTAFVPVLLIIGFKYDKFAFVIDVLAFKL